MSDWTVPRRSDHLDDEVILDDIRRVSGDLDRVPSFKEMCEHGLFGGAAYSDRFDGYSEALVCAGIVESHPTDGPRPVPTETVLADIRRVRDDLGRWPKSYEYNEHGAYTYQLLTHRLDEGWDEILARAKETATTETPHQ